MFDYDASTPLNVEADDLGVARRVRRTHYWIDGPEGRVPLVVTAPAAPRNPCPAILIGHGATTAKDDLYIQGPAQRWARAGFVCVAVDAPRHGERGGDDPFTHDHVARGFLATPEADTFIYDHVVSQRRCLDLIKQLEIVDANRIGYLGFSMGTMLGVPLVAVDGRIQCACFVIGGSFGLGTERDPASWAPLIAPRRVLQLNTTGDQLFTPERARVLHDAFNGPKDLQFFPGTHSEFGGKVFKAMIKFFEAELAMNLYEAPAKEQQT